MKNAQTIISELIGRTHLKSLAKHKCYKKYLDLLPPRFKRAIAFLAVKNGNLLIALSHPGYKMEFNYNKELLKSLLRTLLEHDENCIFMKAEEIIIFVSKYRQQEMENKNSDTVPRYIERAEGNFDIGTDSNELKESFENIRRYIKRNISGKE